MSSFIVTADLHASKGKRISNLIIDYIAQIIFPSILVVLIGIIANLSNFTFLLDLLYRVSEMNKLEEYLLGISIVIVYYIVFESCTSRSLGKYITGTKIVMEDGSKPTVKTIFIRTVSRCIPFDPFSFLSEDCRGWHDSISKTYVVNGKELEEKKRLHFDLERLGKAEQEE